MNSKELSELTLDELEFEFTCLRKEKNILSRKILDIETEMIGLREELSKRKIAKSVVDNNRV